MPEEETSPAEPKSEIAHVLMMDLVGYSTLLIDDQTRLMNELTRLVRGTVHFRVADVAGKLLRLPTGDGMALVFFSDPAAPLQCAIEVAQEVKNKPELRLRMGLHSGPVNRLVDVNESGNVAGAGIDIAQRVMDCGDAGHILLSRRVAYDLAPSPRWNADLHDLGDCVVKHDQKISLVNFHTADVGNAALPEKVKRWRAEMAAREKRIAGLPRNVAALLAIVLLLFCAGGVFVLQHHIRSLTAPPPSAAPPEKSIAVLPFTDLSPRRDQEYFCDGISEEILGALARAGDLRVVARTSSFAFKGKNADASEIGRKLNVASILEGSLRREGDRVRVAAQLINTRDGFEIWSGKFDAELKSALDLEDEITRKIVDALKGKLGNATRPAAPDPEAYDLYLKGLYFSNKSSEEDLRIALGLFEQALQKDPKLSRAWTGIAKVWSWLADAYVKPLDGHPRAEAAARQALVLDERDAEAHAYLGDEKRILAYDLKAADAEWKRALEIDSNSAVAHSYLGLLRSAQGQRQVGLDEIRTAVRLDPFSPFMSTFEVWVDLANGRLDAAFAAAKRTMEIDPNYLYFEPNLALVYREQGKLTEALEIYQRLQTTRKQLSAGLAITYARLNRTTEARQVLTQLVERADTSYYPGEQIAAVYSALGDNNAAFYWIDRAIAEHSGAIHSIAFAPEFRALHSDPRFADALRKIGLDPDKVLKANLKTE